MQFFEVLQQRRSVRAFGPSMPSTSNVGSILDAVSLAPSAGDLQAYRIAMVADPAVKAALAKAAHGQEFITEAPVVLVFFADPARSAGRYDDRGRTLFALQDATIAAAYAQLAASAVGLASCWVGAFDDDLAASAVRAPRGLRAVAILPIGEAAEAPERPPRRSRDALVVHDRFGAGDVAT